MYEEKKDKQLIEIVLTNENVNETIADEAFKEIYNRYYKRIFKLLHNSIENIDDCMDLLQQTFLNVYKNLSKYNNKYEFSTWIYRIAINIVKNYKRSAMRANVFLKEYKILKIDSYNPDYVNIIYEEKAIEDLHHEIQKLPKKFGLPLLLFTTGKLSIHEVAKVFKVSDSAVRKRITRAQEILKNKMKGKINGKD
ncbi:MAG: sigma-70 family RNA polymerase sigma factor [Spirochaetes bacterium]|nr:sigma-70 family RNA polymerase sigma factor [Spirochaetota bacterium]